MNLNLHIIRDELSDIPFQGMIRTLPWEFPIAYVQFCDGSFLPKEPDALYICDTGHLPGPCRANRDLCILCAGTPGEDWLRGACSLLYTEAPLTASFLLNRVMQIFRKYQMWEQKMEQALLAHQPARVLGELTMPFFNNPLYLQGSRFQCIFQIFPDLPRELSPAQQKYLDLYTIADNDFMSMDEINEYLAKKEYQSSLNTHEPTCVTYDRDLNLQMLYLNIFLKDTVIAFLCVDNLFRPIQDKDYAVIHILGGYLKRYMLETELYDVSRSRNFDQMLRRLLNREPVGRSHAEKMLAFLGWQLNDTYFCVLLKPMAASEQEDSLSSIALRVDSCFTNNIYIIHDQSILLVFNMTHLKQTQKELFSSSLPLFRDYMLLGGCSAEFYDFREFPDYCRQAQAALTMGQQLNSSFWYFLYDDYMLPCLLETCREQRPASFLIPGYLKKLLAYDRQKNCQYARLLEIYLSHDRNITDTAAHAGIHRTTVLYRLKRIAEITGMNLDHYQTRLSLMLSFQLLEQEHDGSDGPGD